MNIAEQLEIEHSKSNTLRIIDYVGADPVRFGELVEAFYSDNWRIGQRASWPLSEIALKHPEFVDPYHDRFITTIETPGFHNAIYRNLIRLYQDCDIPEEIEGRLFDRCVFFLNELSTQPIAVKVFAMTVGARIAKKYPDLIPELTLVINDTMKDGSPGILNRGRKILNSLQ